MLVSSFTWPQLWSYKKMLLHRIRVHAITCNDSLPCEKTVCIDGDCEITVSNSSQISPTQESNATDSDDNEDGSDVTKNSIRDTIAERMSLRDD